MSKDLSMDDILDGLKTIVPTIGDDEKAQSKLDDLADGMAGYLSITYYCGVPSGCSKYEQLNGVRIITVNSKGGCREIICNLAQSGCTLPRIIECPRGVRVIPSQAIQVSIEEAILKFNTTECGGSFVGPVNLSWPLTPSCREPFYSFTTDLGASVLVGAFSGEIICH